MPGDQFITGLDLGSYYIKASAITGRNGDIIFSAYGESEGMEDGKITDSVRFLSSVRKVLRQLEIKTGNPVDRIFLSIDSNYVRAEMNRGSSGIGGGQVKDSDLYRALNNSMLVAKQKDEEIVDLLVSEYKIDGIAFTNPRGVKGNLLDVTSQVILAERPVINKIGETLQREDIMLSGTSLSVHGMANLLVQRPDRYRGVLLVDAGHTKTEFSVFRDNRVVYQDTVPLGGKNITRDLSIVLSISMDEAEELKIQFGRGNLDPNFPKYDLIEEVIRARAREILKYVRMLFIKYRGYDAIKEAYVYGGGLCGFRNISSYTEDMLKISTNYITSDIIKSEDVFTLNATGAAFNVIHEIQSDIIVRKFTEMFKKPEKTDTEDKKIEEDYFSIFEKVRNTQTETPEKKQTIRLNSGSGKKQEREKVSRVREEYVTRPGDPNPEPENRIKPVSAQNKEEAYEYDDYEEDGNDRDNTENDSSIRSKLKKLFGIE